MEETYDPGELSHKQGMPDVYGFSMKQVNTNRKLELV